MNIGYYKPSGKVSPLFFLLFLLIIAIALPILSVVYSHLIYYIPFIYLNLLVTIGAGAVIGATMLWARKAGKARNRGVVAIFTLLAAIAFEYLQWCAYIPIVIAEALEEGFDIVTRLWDTLDLLVTPSAVYEWAVLINENGIWGLSKGTAVTGALLLGVWIAEFLIITVAAIIVGQIGAGDPFSEAGGKWYKQSKDTAQACLPADFDAMKARLEAGDISELYHLVRTGIVDSSSFLKIEFYEPPASVQSAPYYLSVNHVTVTIKQGKENENSNTIVGHLGVDRTTVEALRAPQPLQQAPGEPSGWGAPPPVQAPPLPPPGWGAPPPMNG
ncbi:MAG: hypothetical protein LBE83_04370 [Propionibacteriaceae bacterium]|jgi:hypothetical protein|nr:hypothetical protein [Propionibacteriaceae bacterium]